jgi:arylsulfatase A-like enzyme
MYSIAEILKDKGYATGAVSASEIIRRTPGDKGSGRFDYGFDVFEEACQNKDASCVNEHAFSLIDNNQEPFFLYLHYMDVHAPYAPPETFAKKFTGKHKGINEFVISGDMSQIYFTLHPARAPDNWDWPPVRFNEHDISHLTDLYDDEIAYFDTQFKALLDKLEGKGLLGNTIIVFASDHGEEFMEHGTLMHCWTLYDATTDVPLVISMPNTNSRGRRGELVQNLDIVPTIIDYLGFDLSDYDFEGKSLRPVISSDQAIREYVFSFQSVLRSVNDKQYKLIYNIQDNEFQMFDIINDPVETNDLSKVEASKLNNERSELSEALFDWIHKIEGENVLEKIEKSDKAIERLRALGYIH